MKIVCDSCATKYSIADDKVRGKVFKIRCKKCSHIIVVRSEGGEDSAPRAAQAESSAQAAAPDEAEKATKVFDYAGFDGNAPTTAQGSTVSASSEEPAAWHLVIEREQVGPMSASEVRQRFARGEVDLETFTWRDGYADWQKLGSISDFADLRGGAGAQIAASAFGGAGGDHSPVPEADLGSQPDLFGRGGANAGSDSLFGRAGGAVAHASSGPDSAPFGVAAGSPSGQGFSGGSGGGANGLFAAADSGAGGHGDARPMTGQRNENSVLFSLNNLQALAMTGKEQAAPATQKPGYASAKTEGSGLIDIRSMAASTLSAPSHASTGSRPMEDDLPSFGASAFSASAAPVLLPSAVSGTPKWVWAVVGVGGLLAVALVVMGVLLLRHPPAAPPTIAAAAPTPAATGKPSMPGGAAASATPTAAKPGETAAPGTTPPAEGKTAAGEAAKPGDAPAGDKAAKAAVAAHTPPGGAHHHGKTGAVGGAAAAGLPQDSAPSLGQSGQPKAPTRSAPKKGGDELDQLLQGAIGGGSGPATHHGGGDDSLAGGGSHRAPPADDNLPDQLKNSDIQGGLAKVKGKASACYAQYNVPGLVTISLTIGPGGRVQSASPTGKFSGTPTGECVARAVKSASFPRFKGPPMSIEYPFMLSK